MATAVRPAKGRPAGSGKVAGVALAGTGEIKTIPAGLIDPSPYQPRREFAPDELKELAASIAAGGLLQPISVRYTGTEHRERYELIAGERRLRAMRDELQWASVPALVKQADDAQAAALALVENLQRAQLTPFEEAEAYARLMKEQAWTQQQLAERLGVPRSTVGDRVRALALPEPWLALLRAGAVVQWSHAAALLAYKAAPDAVHAAAVARAQRSNSWQFAVDNGRPIEVTAMVSVAYQAYSTDLWPLSRGGLGEAPYEGPVVTVPMYHGGTPERFAADPTIWLPMREAEKRRTQITIGGPDDRPLSPNDARRPRGGEGARETPHGVQRSGAYPPVRPLRDDVVLQLPDNHGDPVDRGLYGIPAGLTFLTDEQGRWNVGHGVGAWEADPADLQVTDATILEVRDTYDGVRRVGTTDGAALDAAEAAWEARWTAREQELRRSTAAQDFTVRGPGVRAYLAQAVAFEDDLVASAVREAARAEGVDLSPAVLAEVNEEDGDIAGEAVLAMITSARQDFVEAIATALLRLNAHQKRTYGDPITCAVRGEREAALAEIATRPVPWVVARPKLLSDANRGLFDEEPAADEGDGDGESLGGDAEDA